MCCLFKLILFCFSSKTKISSHGISKWGFRYFFPLEIIAIFITQKGGSRIPGTLLWLRPWSAFWKMKKLWRKESVPLDIKLKIFQTSCLSVLLYGCESWILTKDLKKSINAFATSCFRIMKNQMQGLSDSSKGNFNAQYFG